VTAAFNPDLANLERLSKEDLFVTDVMQSVSIAVVTSSTMGGLHSRTGCYGRAV
jgi:hypothetical protein